MITSPQNPKIKRVRLLLSQSKARKKQGVFVLEGLRLVEEGLQSPINPETVFYSSELDPKGQELVRDFTQRGVPSEHVAAEVFNALSATETPQGILAIYPFPNIPIPEKPSLLLIADEIRDPGNLGSLLRTSLAANVDGLIFTPGTVDPYSPKVVRAAMGAHFHLPLLQASWETMQIHTKGLQLLLADMIKGDAFWNFDLRDPLAIIIGGEAHGPSKAAFAQADQVIHIPMSERTESLNAGIAGAIILYEVYRQRVIN